MAIFGHFEPFWAPGPQGPRSSPKHRRKEAKRAQNGPKWPKMALFGPKWPKSGVPGEAQIPKPARGNMARRAQNGPKWPKMAQNGPFWAPGGLRPKGPKP